jgi:SAM-dependent methyltransferase
MAQYVRDLYQRRFSAPEQRAVVWSVLAKHFRTWIRPTDSVLDLGAGYCEFINEVEASDKYALDLNPDTRLRAAASVTVFEQRSTDPWPVAAASVDVIFTSNFLEHLPDKSAVTDTVAQAYRALKNGGRFIAIGPNIRCVHGAYWDFFDHYVPLTDLSVAELLESQRFSIEKRVAKFLPYTMSRGPAAPPWMIRAYLRLPPAWLLLGKQFLIVARKGPLTA